MFNAIKQACTWWYKAPAPNTTIEALRERTLQETKKEAGQEKVTAIADVALEQPGMQREINWKKARPHNIKRLPSENFLKRASAQSPEKPNDV